MTDHFSDLTKIVVSVLALIGILFGGSKAAMRFGGKSAERARTPRRQNAQNDQIVSADRIMEFAQKHAREAVAEAVRDEKARNDVQMHAAVTEAVANAVAPMQRTLEWMSRYIGRMRDGVVDYVDDVERWAKNPTAIPPDSQHIRALLDEDPPNDPKPDSLT